MAVKNGKKYLDKNGLNYVWQKIDNKFVHAVDATTGATAGATFAEDELLIGASGRGIKSSSYKIGGATLTTGGVTADGTGLIATEQAVWSAIGDLGTVMSFLGVTTTDVAPTTNEDGTITHKTNPEVVIGSDTKTAQNGDVVIYNTSENEPEEFVWVQDTEETGHWQEIGKVFNDEAIISVGGSGAIGATEGTGDADGQVTVYLNLDNSDKPADWEALGHIELSQTEDGLKAQYGDEIVTINDTLSAEDIDAVIADAEASLDETTTPSWPTGKYADYVVTDETGA